MKKYITTFALVLLAAVTMFLAEPSKAQAKEYDVEGVWKGKINGTTYYLDVKEYGYKNKYIGDISVYEGYENFKKSTEKERIRYRKCKKKDKTTYVNKYYLKVDFGTRMMMKAGAKKISLKQLHGDIDGVKFNGTFKLFKRHSK